jgi:putative transposase
MITKHPSIAVGFFCQIWGYTTSYFYKIRQGSEPKAIIKERIVTFVQTQRGTKESKRLGTIKILYKMKQDATMSDVKLGRDKLYAIMKEEGLDLRKKKRRGPKMTDGNGESIFKDLRKAMTVNEINSLWCCDITYFYIGDDRTVAYLTLIQDEKSHKNVGYHLSWDQEAQTALKALQMAVNSEFPQGRLNTTVLVFHTDRGSQFKGSLFKKFLSENNMIASMCKAGKSYENPVGERINGIIKDEIIGKDTFSTFEKAQLTIDDAIVYFNQVRPHLSNEMLTPLEAHKVGLGPLKKLWRQRKPWAPKQMNQNESDDKDK